MSTVAIESESPFRVPKWTRSSQLSEREYTEKVAKSIRSWDRWRWLLVAIHVLPIVLSCVFVDWLLHFCRDWAVSTPRLSEVPEAILGLGFLLGAKMGFWLSICLNGLIRCFTGLKSERLLVKYYEMAQPIIASTESTGASNES